jgi:AcrR family transcriptional regulator
MDAHTEQTRAVAPGGAGERILAAAYALFSTRGVHPVGVDEIIRTAGVAKATFYKYFPSKDALVVAFLARHQRVWSCEWLATGVAARAGADPEKELLEVFTLLGEWHAASDFAGCSFINTLLELGAEHPGGAAAIGYMAEIRGGLAERAAAAGLSDPNEVAASLQQLMEGATVAAERGDRRAATRARGMASALLATHRPDTDPSETIPV